MSSALNAEFSSIKEKLSDADVDEPTLVKVAAIIAGRYDLVPRGQSQVARAAAPQMARPKPRAVAQEDDLERELLEEYPHLMDLPEEERRREILALRVEAEREFGLSKGELTLAKTAKTSSASTSDIMSAMSHLMPPDISDAKDLDGGPGDPLTMQRMAKLAALRDNPNLNRIRRSDG
jgi:hypothetical protein